jgi:4-hydroxythreonine-4-phosphate dehydrogenase
MNEKRESKPAGRGAGRPSPSATAEPPALIAITMGDPAGVGPEIIARAWPHIAANSSVRPLVVGRAPPLRRAVELCGVKCTVVPVAAPEEASVLGAGSLGCWQVGDEAADDVKPGVIDPRGGQAAYEALIAAADLALAGRVQAIVTAPLHKQALRLAGHAQPGHTELLAERCGVRDVAMMLYLPPSPPVGGPVGLGVAHVTLHVALADAIPMLTSQRIEHTVRLTYDLVARLLSISGQPRSSSIGVAALNPHGGENGLFGREEIDIIAPAIQQASRDLPGVSGPWPCDTLMARAAAGEFDAVVAMYHDQGHIAIKLLGMHRAVNITLGLPIIRTSVAHGTAFDRAGKGTADASSLVSAFETAVRLDAARSRPIA